MTPPIFAISWACVCRTVPENSPISPRLPSKWQTVSSAPWQWYYSLREHSATPPICLQCQITNTTSCEHLKKESVIFLWIIQIKKKTLVLFWMVKLQVLLQCICNSKNIIRKHVCNCIIYYLFIIIYYFIIILLLRLGNEFRKKVCVCGGEGGGEGRA